MFCLQKLESFTVQKQLLQMFSSSVLSSVLTFGLSSWGENISRGDKGAIGKTIKKAGGVVRRTQDSLDTLLDGRMTNKLNNVPHPLRGSRVGRTIIQRIKREAESTEGQNRKIHATSFVPWAVILYKKERNIRLAD